ncbi:MAG TPA: hypothetical protein VEF55_06110 [Candidatus Binatia bacterium]|nr:hypothetical protein [Candidatus Binatia bacterium]
MNETDVTLTCVLAGEAEARGVMISRRQLAMAASSAKRAGKARRIAYGQRDRSKPALLWTWLAYVVAAFAVGLGLFFGAVQMLETAARIAG